MHRFRLSLLLAAVAVAGAASAQSAYSTGFESPTYAAGSTVVGSGGWIAGSGSGTTPTVSSAQAFAGTQSLALTNSSSFFSVRQAYAFAASTAYAGSVKVYVSSATQASRLFGMYFSTSTQGGTTLGMTIGGDGGIRAGAAWSPTYATTANNTAAAGTFADRWLTMDFTLNGAGGGTTKISGFSDGSSYSYSFTGVSTASYILLGTDYTASSTATGTAYFDNFSIAPQAVPEPSTVAALGLGAVALLRRSRRKSV